VAPRPQAAFCAHFRRRSPLYAITRCGASPQQRYGCDPATARTAEPRNTSRFGGPSLACYTLDCADAVKIVALVSFGGIR
jgi:hypothetical protein